MTKVLSESEVKNYQQRGYHFPVDVLSQSEVADFRGKLEEYEARTGGPIQGEMRHRSHVLFPWINDVIRHPKILDAVEDVLGPNLYCWNTSFFIKEARDPGFVSWHQDATYWGLSSPDVMTVWLALSPANKVSGCMKFIPGTHKSQAPHADTFHKDNLLSRGQEIAVEVNEDEAVYAELKTGQASLHHVLLFHGSDPNQADHRRVGFAIRYVPTHVHQVSTIRDSATLVRGVDTYNYFDHEIAPAADMHPDAVARHKEIMDRQLKILYAGAKQSGRLGATVGL